MRERGRVRLGYGLRELITELGGDADKLFASVGITEGIFERPDKLASAEPFYVVLNLAAQALGRPDLGLLWGVRTDLSTLGPLYVAVANAGNGREAMEYMCQYLHTQTQALDIYLSPLRGEHRHLVGMRHVLKQDDFLAQSIERNLVMVHRLLMEVCGADYRASRVLLQHRQVSAQVAYKNVFGVVPEFEQPQTGIVVEDGMLDSARPRQSAQLRQMAENYLRSLQPAASRSFSAETADMTRILFRSADCSATDVARALGIQTRTLQRRLQAEETSFEKIKDDVRRDLADKYLADTALPITEIAFRLYYANAPAFSRSCARWFGVSPSERRRELGRRL